MSYAFVYLSAVTAVVVGCLALIGGTVSYRIAYLDRRDVIRRRIGNGRRLVAYRGVRAERARLAKLVLLVVPMAALIASEGPPDTQGATIDTALGVFFLSYTMALVLMAWDAWDAVRSRRELDAELASHRNTVAEAHHV